MKQAECRLRKLPSEWLGQHTSDILAYIPHHSESNPPLFHSSVESVFSDMLFVCISSLGAKYKWHQKLNRF